MHLQNLGGFCFAKSGYSGFRSRSIGGKPPTLRAPTIPAALSGEFYNVKLEGDTKSVNNYRSLIVSPYPCRKMSVSKLTSPSLLSKLAGDTQPIQIMNKP